MTRTEKRKPVRLRHSALSFIPLDRCLRLSPFRLDSSHLDSLFTFSSLFFFTSSFESFNFSFDPFHLLIFIFIPLGHNPLLRQTIPHSRHPFFNPVLLHFVFASSTSSSPNATPQPPLLFSNFHPSNVSPPPRLRPFVAFSDRSFLGSSRSDIVEGALRSPVLSVQYLHGCWPHKREKSINSCLPWVVFPPPSPPARSLG